MFGVFLLDDLYGIFIRNKDARLAHLVERPLDVG